MTVRSTEPGQGIASADLDYQLDPALIATSPAHPRDHARMMVFHRESGRVEHRLVCDLADYIVPGSAMVVNETRVEPLRFVARRRRDGRTTEGLFVVAAAEGWWEVLIKGARRFRTGDQLDLLAPGDELPKGDSIELLHSEDGSWKARFMEGRSAHEVWDRSGRTPLPPYIVEARQRRHEEAHSDASDRADYQTVFARTDSPLFASCAAPTAGLHFTAELLSAIAAKGVRRVAIELQVGPGTFRPVEAARLGDHPMHGERCVVRAGTAVDLAAIDPDLSLVVGTTSVRCLESLSRPLPSAMLEGGSSERVVADFETKLLIAPGFEFQWTRRLLTNFHLPRSTLLALVGALVGLDQLKALYAQAQAHRYRFYSLGDAMLILP